MVDADATNFEIALQYVQHNLKHHKFADMGSNGFEVRRHYEDVIDKLDLLAEHTKANTLRALCSAPARLAAPLREWNTREHLGG